MSSSAMHFSQPLMPALRLALCIAVAAAVCALLPQAQGATAGQCDPPAAAGGVDGLVAVSCLSPGVVLAPGDNLHPTVVFPNPYPVTGVAVAVVAQSMWLVDISLRAVPLDECYLHHGFADYNFIAVGGPLSLISTRMAMFRARRLRCRGRPPGR
jgi:hypothetical protein